MQKLAHFIFFLSLISTTLAQSPLVDLHLCKLQNGVFTKMEYNLINGDTIYKKFEKYLTAIENGDSIVYLESFNLNRSWTLERFVVSGKERVAAGWQSEYDINGYKLIDRYCNLATGDCNLYKRYSYYPNGKPLSVLTYYKHKLNGISYFYHNDGSLKNCIEYKNDRLWNILAYYDLNGNILDQGNFCDGDGIVNVYATNGKLIKIKWYKSGKTIKEIKSSAN